MKEYFIGIWHDRYILFSLVNVDLQSKYRRSVLGIAWTVLTPLGLVLIIGSVYSIIFDFDFKEFVPILFAGLNSWIFINASADGGTNAFLSAEGYLKQTTVNAQIFPLRLTIVNFVNLLYSIIAFFAVYLFLEPQIFGPKMLLLFPGLVIIFIFTLSLANISAVVNLYLRDFQPLQGLVLQGLFYVTPIIYKPEMLADKGFEFVYLINPLYYIVEVIKIPMLGKELLEVSIYLIAIGITLTLFICSVALVMNIKKGIAFKL